MATSIRRGVERCPMTEAIVVAVGDQPGLDPRRGAVLIARWRRAGLPIVSASYRGGRGHPVLFARPVFAELVELQGDAGARLLIEPSGAASVRSRSRDAATSTRSRSWRRSKHHLDFSDRWCTATSRAMTVESSPQFHEIATRSVRALAEA